MTDGECVVVEGICEQLMVEAGFTSGFTYEGNTIYRSNGNSFDGVDLDLSMCNFDGYLLLRNGANIQLNNVYNSNFSDIGLYDSSTLLLNKVNADGFFNDSSFVKANSISVESRFKNSGSIEAKTILAEPIYDYPFENSGYIAAKSITINKKEGGGSLVNSGTITTNNLNITETNGGDETFTVLGVVNTGEIYVTGTCTATLLEPLFDGNGEQICN